MDRKGIKLTKKVLEMYTIDYTDENKTDIKKWSKVVDHVDDWDEVRNYICEHVLHFSERDKALQVFEQACQRYNAECLENNVEEPQFSTKAKVGIIAAVALGGLALGLRHDPNKRWSVFKK